MKEKKKGLGCLIPIIGGGLGSYDDDTDMTVTCELESLVGKKRARKLLSGKVKGLRFGDLMEWTHEVGNSRKEVKVGSCRR